MQKYLTFLIALSFSSLIFAQNDFRPGFYISNKNDTVNGLLNYTDDILISNLVEYKNDSGTIQFYPTQISGFRFQDFNYYSSKKIINGSDTANIFVQYLVDGIVDLFYYKDLKGDHYLIEYKNGPIELIQKEEKININGKETVRIIPEYKSTLRLLFSDCMIVQRQIDRMNFDLYSLTGLVKKYNNEMGKGKPNIVYIDDLTQKKIKENYTHTGKTIFIPVIGLSLADSGFPYTISNELVTSPVFGVRVLRQINKHYKKAFIVTGIAYSSFKSNVYEEIDFQKTDQSLTAHYIYIPLEFLLYLSSSRVKPYVHAEYCNVIVRNAVYDMYTRLVVHGNVIDPSYTHKVYNKYLPGFSYGPGLRIDINKSLGMVIEGSYIIEKDIFDGKKIYPAFFIGIAF